MNQLQQKLTISNLITVIKRTCNNWWSSACDIPLDDLSKGSSPNFTSNVKQI